VTVTVNDVASVLPTDDPAAPTPWSRRLAIVAIVAVAASPIGVAALSLVGDSWYPVGDLSHILFRVGQVGTRGTPLVGAETVKGWAHPGPLEFWLAAPVYRLLGKDPRALFWTAAIINVAVVGAIARVAWRRGRFPLLIGAMAIVAVLLHSLGPGRIVSIWNPYLPLLPFLLTVVLAWDVALGHRQSLVWMAVSATLAAQTHVAFLTLSCLVVVWLLVWTLSWQRVVAPAAGRAEGLPGRPWDPWWRALRRSALVAGVLWLPVALDAVFDLHNPLKIAKSIATPPATVGPVDAISLVGRYVRPDGPWMGGVEPVSMFSVRGSGPLPLVLALVVLSGCLWLGRRRQLVDVVALATLALTLVLGSIPAASQIFLPAYAYLTQFLKVVGVVVWATVAWTCWRLAAPWVRARTGRTAAAAAIATVALIGAAAWSWGDAATLETPNPADEAAVQEIRAQLNDVLPTDQRIRVEFLGDHFNIPGPGVISWLIEDGHSILTSDGAHGLKWGHEHRWQRGEDYDMLLTVAVYYTGSFDDPVHQCADDPTADLIAGYDPLSPQDRRWLDDLRLRHLADPESITSGDEARADLLVDAGPLVGVFEGPRVCAKPPRS
jgi:hypothetical protein